MILGQVIERPVLQRRRHPRRVPDPDRVHPQLDQPLQQVIDRQVARGARQHPLAPADGIATDLAIEATGLTKTFGSTVAVDGVDLAVPRGGVYGVLGPNGAGKTTTMRMLATLTSIDGGSARVLGHDVATDASETLDAASAGAAEAAAEVAADVESAAGKAKKAAKDAADDATTT